MWLINKLILFLKRMVIDILKCGPLPNHIGIILDGNRRFAKGKNFPILKGYQEGIKRVSHVLDLMKIMGIKEATLYALSIENFRRTKEDLNDICSVIKKFIKDLILEREELMKRCIRVRMIGNLTLLDEEMLKLIQEITSITKDNNGFCFNFAIAYSSRQEMTSAIKSVVTLAQEKQSDIVEATENLIARNLYTSTKVDLLIRTSGEIRLSDFLLWQSTDAILYFSEVLWPEFSFWNMIAMIFNFQYWSKYRSNESDLNMSYPLVTCRS